jgi:hypothetical protein
MGEAIDLAPAHGEHTDRLLGEIGFDTRQIAALRSARVVRLWLRRPRQVRARCDPPRHRDP